MFIIYNLSGLLVGIAGVIVGLLALTLTGSLALGLMALAVVWFALGIWWRSRVTESGEKRPFPSVFFIPVPFVAILVAVLAVLMFFIERTADNQPVDPRAASFKADAKMLSQAQATGDVALSQSVLNGIQAAAIDATVPSQNHVFTRRNEAAVLVLVKVPELKNYTDDAQRRLLDAVVETLQADKQSKGLRIYVGIKGRLLYGAVRIPPDEVKIGSFVSESMLYEFYGENEFPASTDPVSVVR